MFNLGGSQPSGFLAVWILSSWFSGRVPFGHGSKLNHQELDHGFVSMVPLARVPFVPILTTTAISPTNRSNRNRVTGGALHPPQRGRWRSTSLGGGQGGLQGHGRRWAVSTKEGTLGSSFFGWCFMRVLFFGWGVV